MKALSDWASIESNLISDFIFLLLTLIITPIFTLFVLRLRSRKTLVNTYSHILIEFCDFLSYSQYRNTELNSEHLEIFTHRERIKEYRFVSISIVNTLNKIVYPKIEIVIYELHKKQNVENSYAIFKDELSRLKELRVETEKILAIHSLYVTEKLISRISQLCLQIRKLEITEKNNIHYQKVVNEVNDKMTGIFGISEISKIYKSIFSLISEILATGHFDYKVTRK